MSEIVTQSQVMLSDKQVCELLGVSRSHFWRMISAGLAPKQVHVGGRVSRWRRTDIDAWIQNDCKPVRQ